MEEGSPKKQKLMETKEVQPAKFNDVYNLEREMDVHHSHVARDRKKEHLQQHDSLCLHYSEDVVVPLLHL